MPVLWLASARDDLRQIVTYIAREHPYLYPPSERVPGQREIVAHPNYLVLYRVAATRIEIVNVVHARRQFPETGAKNT